MLAPICLFTYNRLEKTQNTIEALQRNYLAKDSDLYIFSDGFKDQFDLIKVNAVRDYIYSVQGFKSVTITKSEVNKGLANSIIQGVSQLFRNFEKIIVFEDDLVTLPNCLNYMNMALNHYEGNSKIQSVNAYSLSLKDKNSDVYFQVRPGSWGWGTWKNRWNEEIFNEQNIRKEIKENPEILKQFKDYCGPDMPKMLMNSIYNRNDSWYVRWAYDHFKHMHYSVFPTYSYVKNIGHHINATHCKGINSLTSFPADGTKIEFDFPEFDFPDQDTTNDFLHYFSLVHKLKIRLKLLKTYSGRALLVQELKTRLNQYR